MFTIEAFVVLKIKEFTLVNDWFQNKNNLPDRQAGEESGHYGQTLIRKP